MIWVLDSISRLYFNHNVILVIFSERRFYVFINLILYLPIIIYWFSPFTYVILWSCNCLGKLCVHPEYIRFLLFHYNKVTKFYNDCQPATTLIYFFGDLRLAVNKVRFLFYFNKILLLILENAFIYLPPWPVWVLYYNYKHMKILEIIFSW